MALGYRTEAQEALVVRIPADPVARSIRRIYAGAGPLLGMPLYVALASGSELSIIYVVVALLVFPISLMFAYVLGLPAALAAGWTMTGLRRLHPLARLCCSVAAAVLASSLWGLFAVMRRGGFVVPLLITSAVCALLLGLVAIRMERRSAARSSSDPVRERHDLTT